MIEMFSSLMMIRALIVAFLVGATAPIIGTYLVQRRLALLGDGIGHIALTGVAVGWLVGAGVGLLHPEDYALPGAAAVTIIGAISIELMRTSGKVAGDVALAILFYGGIAGGALLIQIAGGTHENLLSYLFGSIATVSWEEVWWTVGISILILIIGLGLRGPLFAISNDEEFAQASGLPIRLLSTVLAALTALTVTFSMQAIGLLLVSAIMIVPVAAAQTIARSFRGTMWLASIIGVTVSVTGLIITYWHNLPPGAVVVTLAIGVYAVLGIASKLIPRSARLISARSNQVEVRDQADPHDQIESLNQIESGATN